MTWNDKYLDYEIETNIRNLLCETAPRPTWNDKYLDYEIETKAISVI